MRADHLAQKMNEWAVELAPEYGLEAVDWDFMPESDKGLLVAICRRVVSELNVSPQISGEDEFEMRESTL